MNWGMDETPQWSDREERRSAMAGTHIIGRALLTIGALFLVALIARILT